MIIRTEFGNFGCTEDLLRFMQEEVNTGVRSSLQ